MSFVEEFCMASRNEDTAYVALRLRSLPMPYIKNRFPLVGMAEF